MFFLWGHKTVSKAVWSYLLFLTLNLSIFATFPFYLPVSLMNSSISGMCVFPHIWHFCNSLLQLHFILRHGFICIQTCLHSLLKCQLPWKRWYFQLVWRRCVHHLSSLLGLCQRSLIDDSLPPHRAQMLFGTHWSNTSLLTDHRVPFK